MLIPQILKILFELKFIFEIWIAFWQLCLIWLNPEKYLVIQDLKQIIN